MMLRCTVGQMVPADDPCLWSLTVWTVLLQITMHRCLQVTADRLQLIGVLAGILLDLGLGPDGI